SRPRGKNESSPLSHQTFPRLPPPTHLASLKSVAGFRQAFPLSQDTDKKFSRKSDKMTLVPAPRSFFMDVKCPGCFTITTVFSHAQTVVICQGCTTVLCQPTGGKARLTEGCSFRRK
ncbi:unnamed protein product, partial [Fusarium graminearum]